MTEYAEITPTPRDRISKLTVEELLAFERKEREFRKDVNVRFAARLVLSAGNWTYAWFRPGGEMGATEIGERFAELLIQGLEA